MRRHERFTRRLVMLAVLAAVLVLAYSNATATGQGRTIRVNQERPAVPGEVLVKFRTPPGGSVVADVARQVDADRHRPVGGAGARLFHSRRFGADEMIARLSKRGDVAWVEPNFVVTVAQGPSDPQFPQLWGLQNLGQAVNGGLTGTPGADIHAVPAWEVSTGSRDVVVAVIDTGIDYTHPDLAPNVWSAPAPFTVTIGGVTISCEAGTHGFNAITGTCDPMDDHNHGTHVSGTIGAVGDNDLGVVGVNWTAAIMAAKFIGADGSGTTADGIDAIEFAVQAKAAFAGTGSANVRVLSNSWGAYSFSQALLDEINRAAGNDMLFVAAAGNNSFSNDILPFYPASYKAPNVISVAATDNADQIAYFSNYGARTVHLGAPGVDILSTTVGGTYSFFSGTSMATPHVAGAAALVLSKCAFDTVGLRADLLSNVDQVAGLSGQTVTGGRLNVERAIHACTEVPAAPEGLSATAGNAQVSLAWTAVSGATTYNIKRGTQAGGPHAVVDSVSANAYVDSAVANDVTYYYVVSAANLAGESEDSAEVAATPRIPPDLVVSALTLPATAAPGDTIVVTDTTRNQGGGMAVATVTRFYLSTNAALDAADTLLDGTRAVPELAPGVASEGSTSLRLPPADGAPGIRYIIAVADADNAAEETSETNNTLARSIRIGTDLIVSQLSVPSFVGPGASVVVTDTVTNQGAGQAGPSLVRFYVSANTVLDVGDTVVDGSRTVTALGSGESSTGTTQVTMPADLAVGRYYLVAMADADNTVAETSELNNTSARSIQCGPDLTISGFTAPGTGGAGAAIVVSETVGNQGSATAAPSTTRFYLSTNTILDPDDTLLDSSRGVASLAAGESSSGSTTVTLPPAAATGNYYLIARADADGGVAETSETNNTGFRLIVIGPDLVVSAFQVPSGVASGSQVSLTDTVKNQGGGAAAASVTRFYLSTNTVLDGGDTPLEGSRAVSALAAGASDSGTTRVTIPSGLAGGLYYLIAQTDADGQVAETSESNNSSARGVTMGPDLVVYALQVPASVAPGSAVTVTDTVKNQGTGGAGPSTTRFYLSANVILDAGDTLLGGSRAVPALASGASSAGTVSVTIPEDVGVGTFYLIAKADADGAVAETSETNNTSARSTKAGPDLVVSAMKTLAKTPSGGTVSATVTTKNQGSTASGASTTRFYLSANAVLDAGDTLLDGGAAVPALAAGSSGTATVLLTIPSGLSPGTYYVFAKADADNDVAETTETNNTFIRSISITPGK